MYAGRKKCLSALAGRHNVFILQGDTGAEIDVPRVLLRLPKDEYNNVPIKIRSIGVYAYLYNTRMIPV